MITLYSLLNLLAQKRHPTKVCRESQKGYLVNVAKPVNGLDFSYHFDLWF